MRSLNYAACDEYAGDLGIGGSTVAIMAARAAACDASLRAGKTKRILVIWIGCNDLFQGGMGAATYTAIIAYVQARRAAGWSHIVLLTVLPSTKVATPGTYEAERVTLNTLILGNAGGLATAIVDVAADARLQTTTNAVYFNADLLHLVSTGYSVVASLVKPVLQALF